MDYQSILKNRVWEIIKEARENNNEEGWEIYQQGIESINGYFTLILIKQRKDDYTVTKYHDEVIL
jgi:hypothetical protein